MSEQTSCPICFNMSLLTWADENERTHGRCDTCGFDLDDANAGGLVPVELTSQQWAGQTYAGSHVPGSLDDELGDY